MINQDFIVNQISSLGSSDFDIVVSFVLKDILGRQIANVNAFRQWILFCHRTRCAPDIRHRPCLQSSSLDCQCSLVRSP